MVETAVLGGGCFWCLEAALRQLKGVREVVSGYCGGHVANPDYRQVCDGQTGHAEVVRITFDNEQLSYHDLLRAFFAIHDPTTKNRQGNDVGTQYRSVIFCQSEEQRATAEQLIAALSAKNIWSLPVVTQIAGGELFYEAEPEHQHYLANHPSQPYCALVVAPKVRLLREQLAELIRHG